MKNTYLLFIFFVVLLCLIGCAAGEETTGNPSISSRESTAPSPGTTTSVFLPTIPMPSTTIPNPTTQPEEPFSIVQYMPKVENGGKTYTGLPALPAIDYTVIDPMNLRKLSTSRVDHAFGAASNGKPHTITVENQKRFDHWGTEALAWDAVSEEKVLYLTFDCGYEYENLTSVMLDTLRKKGVSVTFFCTLSYIRSSPNVVARMIAEGHHVGNHSQTHPSDCASLSREQMALEALAVENHLRVNFGYSAKYFRFPSGIYSENAVELLHSVGYRSIFWSIAYADWDPENQQGTEVALKTLKDRLHPGAVILLHTTSPDNAHILEEFIDYALSRGYRFADLDEYPGWH